MVSTLWVWEEGRDVEGGRWGCILLLCGRGGGVVLTGSGGVVVVRVVVCGVDVVVTVLLCWPGSSCRNLKENKTPANSDQCSQSTSTVGHPTGRLIRRKE